MNDLISREEAIKAMTEAYEDTDAEHILRKIPPAQQWVPVSERLPYMRDKIYFVTFAWGFVGVMEYKSTGFHNYGSFTPVPIESIIAWMPLPEPYRGGTE